MKTHTTINVDNELLKQAKLKFINVSKTCEDALRLQIRPTLHDAPDEALKMACMKCGKGIEFGFLCKFLDMLYCTKCNLEEIGRCPHGVERMHEHIRIPSLDGSRE